MSYHVLIVDDEEIVCRGLAQFVKWQDYGFAVALLLRTAPMKRSPFWNAQR